MIISNSIGALIGKVFEDGYIDDKTNLLHKIDDVVVVIKDLDFNNVFICPHFDKTYYLSPLYLNENDDAVHLSKYSIGMVAAGDVEAYNKMFCINNNLNTSEINTDIILYHINKKAFAHRYGLPGMVGYSFTW